MGCYSHLSDDEREQIGLAEALGHSIGAIAQAIGRPKSTVWRELSRNCFINPAFHSSNFPGSGSFPGSGGSGGTGSSGCAHKAASVADSGAHRSGPIAPAAPRARCRRDP